MQNELLLSACGVCGQVASGCPHCINTILIDPETAMPPDVRFDEESSMYVPCEPTEEAVARSIRRPVCDACIRATMKKAPSKGLMTAEQRHYTNCRGTLG